MTAIVFAGRTGAAFAAQIGTQKVNEEVNALSTFGLDPIHFLVMPRVYQASPLHPLLHRCLGSIPINLERPDPGAIKRTLRVLEDGGAEVKLFPEGPITVGQFAVLYVQTGATGEVTLHVDGRPYEATLKQNELSKISLLGAGLGEHTLQVRVYDGTRAVWSNVVLATYDDALP